MQGDCVGGIRLVLIKICEIPFHSAAHAAPVSCFAHEYDARSQIYNSLMHQALRVSLKGARLEEFVLLCLLANLPRYLRQREQGMAR